ncbi:MAG: restriction endonuclease subunit S [Chloroflexota bacterium]|nr:restriction endonuclease subunit S [Chloroflexota bacterium]
MNEWREARLGDVVEFQRGYDLPARERTRGEVPVVSSGGVSGSTGEARVPGPGVVTGRYGTLGQVFYVRQPFWPLNTTLFVRDFKGNDPLFVSYLLRTVDFLAYSDKAAVPGVNRNDLHEARVSIPPLHEQQRIAGILGAIDDKRELNRLMSRTIEAIGRLLYRTWSSEQRPDAWRPINEIATVLSGGTPSRSDSRLWTGSIPWISPKVMPTVHCDEPESFVSADAIGNGTRLAPAGSTLLMVRGMGLHEGVRVSQARSDVTFNQDVKALVPHGIEPTLLLFGMLDAQRGLLARVESSGHGTGVLPTDVVVNWRIAVGDEVHRRHLVTQLNAINERIGAAREQTRTLAMLRDLLLRPLLSGAFDADRVRVA